MPYREVTMIEAPLRHSGRAWDVHFGHEVTNVSVNGFWLLLDQKELFLPLEQFPWFTEAALRQLTRVERPSQHHL